MPNDRIDVVVVDDSAVSRLHLGRIIESDALFRVVASLDSGAAAIDFIRGNKVDVVLMDIHMPGMDGFEATRLIMESHPLPIVICSATTNPTEVAVSFRAMEAGAVACVEKPVGRRHADHDRVAENLRQTIRLMSEVKVVRRRRRSHSVTFTAPPLFTQARSGGRIEVVGIGTSTGGPPVLQTILSSLPKDFPASILIVQHIALGFLQGLLEWLGASTGFRVRIAGNGDTLEPGVAYIAPDGCHMGLSPDGRIALSSMEPENGVRPAVSFLFRSLAQVCGPRAIGVLLTGMGKDGAEELKLMRDCGAVTIAQDRESSVVHGMPGQAIALDGATHVLPADRIADALVSIVAAEKTKDTP